MTKKNNDGQVMKMKRITIYDVAKEANVSLATVSRVINGSDVVREDTRLKVEEAINKLGYKPNCTGPGVIEDNDHRTGRSGNKHLYDGTSDQRTFGCS